MDFFYSQQRQELILSEEQLRVLELRFFSELFANAVLLSREGWEAAFGSTTLARSSTKPCATSVSLVKMTHQIEKETYFEVNIWQN